MIVREQNYYLTKCSTVRRSAKKKRANKKVKASIQFQDQVQYATTRKRTTQEEVQISGKKNYERKPDEPDRDVSAFTELGEVSLFKNKN